jgi:hypothetical protein
VSDIFEWLKNISMMGLRKSGHGMVAVAFLLTPLFPWNPCGISKSTFPDTKHVRTPYAEGSMVGTLLGLAAQDLLSERALFALDDGTFGAPQDLEGRHDG